MKRVFAGQEIDEGDEDFFLTIKNQYKKAFACVEKVQDYIKKEYGKPNKYEGYELQTFGNQPKRKANIFNQDKDQYANNIWIGDFFSILDKGPKTIENECYIDVEHKYCFNDLELKEDGYWKGAISFEFSKFIKQCIKNAQNGDIEANKKMQWPMY